MTPEVWQRVCRVFEQVSELAPVQRDEFLRQLRQSDGEVGSQVEALLGQHDAPSILESPPSKIWDALAEAVTGISSVAPSKEWPATIGPYVIEGELARGGMGIVLRATDTKFGRPLAVKILDRKHQHDGSLGERFLEEARITGQLQHPGIPPVYDMGRLADGRPFLAMKLIHGQTFAALLAACGSALASSPAPALSGKPEDLARCIDVFDQICQTMAYAHTRKVIHRDLKPGNIMVGAFGEVQVMDWGLAKQLDGGAGITVCGLASESVLSNAKPQPEGRTRAGSIMGSPAYIAPEQARGEVEYLDERCDVFGLGAILCEILTGKPPFAAGNSRESLRLAGAGNLSAALALLEAPGVDATLAALAKQCLAPERDDRPRDAGAVAAAVANYRSALQERLKKAEIEQAAAQARAESEQAKAREERRRRQATRALAALAMLFVIAASAATVWYFHHEAEVEKQAEREQAQRKASEQLQKDKLTASIDDMLHKEDSSARHLKLYLDNNRDACKMFTDLDRWGELLTRRAEILAYANVKLDEGRGLLDQAVIDRVKASWDRYRADEKDFALARKLDEVQMDSYMLALENRGQSAAGDKYDKILSDEFHIAVRTTDPKEAAGIIDKSNLRYVLVAVLDHWAEMSQYPESKYSDLLPRLLAIARLADPHPWRDRFRQPAAWLDKDKLQELAKDIDPAEHSPQLLIAFAMRLDAKVSRDQGRAAMQQALLFSPKNFWLHMAMPYFVSDRREQAAYAEAARAVRPDSSVACSYLGMYLLVQKEVNPASKAANEATAIEALVQATNLDAKNAGAWYHLAWGYQATGKLDDAFKTCARAVAVRSDYLRAWNLLETVANAQSKLDEVVELCRQTVAKEPHNCAAHMTLARILKKQGHLAEADQAFKSAYEVAADEFNDPDSFESLGNDLVQTGEFAAAADVLQIVVRMTPKKLSALRSLGRAFSAQKKYDAAAKVLNDAVVLAPTDGALQAALGYALVSAGRFGDGRVAMQKALREVSEYDWMWFKLRGLLALCEPSVPSFRANLPSRP